MPVLFDPDHDAELLRRATKNWKTDHAALIYVVAENERTNEQMQELRRAFQGEYKECPIEVVKKATNLPYQSAYSTALVATLLTPMDFAADTLYLAMKSFNKDERAMIQILAHASKDEVEHIKETYLRIRHRTLESDILKEFSGKERKFFLGLINAPRSHVDVAAAQDFIDRDVKELYIAGPGRGWSSDISAFIKIITKHDNEYLTALNVAYGRKYGDSLVRAVEKQFSNNVLGKGMGAMILDRSDYYASELNKAIAGTGTDTDTLTRIVGIETKEIATQRHTMPAICLRYMLNFRKNLRQHLEQERAVGDSSYGRVLQSLLKVAETTGRGECHSIRTTSEPPSTPSKSPQPPNGPSLETQLSSSPQNPPSGRSLETHSYDDLGRPSSGRSLATHSYGSLGRLGHVPLPGVRSYPAVPAPGTPTPGYPPAPYGTPPPQSASPHASPANPYTASPHAYPADPYTASPHGYPAAPYAAPPHGYPADPYTASPHGYPANSGYAHPDYAAATVHYPPTAYTYPRQDDASPSCPPAPDHLAHAFARLSAHETEEAKRAADAAEWKRKIAEQREQEDARYAQQVADFCQRTRVLEQQQREAKSAADKAHAQRIEEGDARLAKELQETENEAANQRRRQEAGIAALEQFRRETEAAARARAQEREREDARYALELAEADRQAAATAERARRELQAELAAARAWAQQSEEADKLYAQQLDKELNAAEEWRRQAEAAEEQRRQAAVAEERRRQTAAAAAEAAAAARRQEEDDARLARRLWEQDNAGR